ncbi:AAA family ATPase [Terracoccus sp. 273MFTsu3.1]|uniref:phosphatase domain-containing protein n=1 Tax=Terracoccus sp. 273MFTsu3.1 TaxID=1172188 RepID=UPI00035E85AB|nr:AAA family ATPase [Terracoccus sp. 273MFTsu3.1]
MTDLIITRGLPGSGKTTFAKSLVQSTNHPMQRVNRDDLREMRFGKTHGLTKEQEEQITTLAKAQVSGALKAGISVVIDDTNLNKMTVKQWQRMAFDHDADFRSVDFEIPVEKCIAWSMHRWYEGGRKVPEDAIRKMHKRYFKNGEFPLLPEIETPPVEPYVAPKGKPEAYVVDIDGTLTLGPHNRGPFQWHKVEQDLPNAAVIDVVNNLWSGGDEIIFLSGRSEEARAGTKRWLEKHTLVSAPLYMRPAGDWRRDDIVKQELFDLHVRYDYHVLGVFDDRAQVVRQWRRIGLPVFQVADGDF